MRALLISNSKPRTTANAAPSAPLGGCARSAQVRNDAASALRTRRAIRTSSCRGCGAAARIDERERVTTHGLPVRSRP
jgi:hypothetical protein